MHVAKGHFRRQIVNVLAIPVVAILLAPRSPAQTATVALSAASIGINPAATDTYDIQGSFTGLSLTGASFVNLSVGNFAAAIPVSSFVQQPGTNVFVYQDTTGQTPYWVSTLTIDLDGQAFEAQAAGIVLAGLSNPFAFQLGTDLVSACTMARVQQVDTGSYQLTPGDPVGRTCELANLPLPYPTFVPIGTPTDVTLSTTAQAFGGSGVPQNPLVFRADDNAQPVGDPLCVMSVQTDGSYACTATFNETEAGMIPLVVQAAVAGRMVLSPGFSVQAVAPPTDDDVQQLQAVENAIMQAWQNFTQYGDSVYARILTLQSLRQLLQPDPVLSGHPIGLSANGLDISVLTDGGLPVTSILNDLSDQLAQAGSAAALGKQMRARNTARASAQRLVKAAPAAQTPLTCGSPKRDVVWNKNVLIWDPSFFEGNPYGAWSDDVSKMFQNSKCPNNFNVSPPVDGAAAGPASMQQFSNFGTVILNTHGGYDRYGYVDILTGLPTNSQFDFLTTRNSGLTVGCVEDTCYFAVLPWSTFLKPLHTNTIVYMGLCHGNEFLKQPTPTGLTARWVAPGSNVAFFNFREEVAVGYDAQDAHAVFDQLINHAKSTGDAKSLAPSPAAPTLFDLQGDSNLAYTGNPMMISKSGKASRTGARALFLPPGTQQFSMNMSDPPMALEAQIEGADSCQVNYQWSNTATAGHVKSDTGGSGQDNFTDMDANIEYTPLVPPVKLFSSPPYFGYDTVMANFMFDPADPPVAQACGQVLVNVPLVVGSSLAATYDAGHGSIPVATEFSPPKAVGSSYSIQDAGTYKGFGASANVTVTNTGTNQWTVSAAAGGSTPGANQGPYTGKVQLDLLAMNPGPTGKGKIQISGMFNNNAGCGSSQVCSFPDGEVTITDSLGKITNISLIPSDKAPNPFTVTADSSLSSTGPVEIYIGMNANSQLSTPATFTVNLTIQFLNQ